MIHAPVACQFIHGDLKVSVIDDKRSVIRGMAIAYFGATEGHWTGKMGLFQSPGSVFVTVLPVSVTHGYFLHFERFVTDENVVPVKDWYGEGHAPVDRHLGP